MKTCEQVIAEKVKNLATYYYERYRISRAEFMTTPRDRVNTRKLYREEMLTWKEAIERMAFLKLINLEDYKL